MASFAVRAVAVAALSLALSLPACSSTPAVCPCHGMFSAYVAIPPPDADATPAAIVTVSTDPPCVAADDGTGHVTVSRPLAGRCDVLVRLSNNDIYTFSVEFQAVGQAGACCSNLPFPVDASVPVLFDAGTGG